PNRVAHPVRALPPREYTSEALIKELHQRLTPAELELLVNPLASSSGICGWAQRVTQDATNDTQRARLLFETLERHPGGKVSKVRTAQEVFQLLNNPKEPFCCQDYTKLLIAGARDAGLKAFYTHLERDYAGNIVYHDCAVIFAGGEAMLVDPAYHWFGAPH